MKAVFIGGPILLALFLIWLWVERWHLLLPGTWPALKWLGFRRTLTGGLHGLWYGRHITSYLNCLRKLAYLFGPETRYGRWLVNSYHGKVIPPALAKSIITIKEAVPLQDLGVSVIPYHRARDIMIDAPPDIVVTQCGCKQLHHEQGRPCTLCAPPYMTCMLIGKPLTDFLLDHKPENTRRITREEALELLDAFHCAGMVHAAWFKDCIKDRFYVICNCCSCCCFGFEMAALGFHQMAPSGFVADVDLSRCEGCGTAQNWCPFGAIMIHDGGPVVLREKCMGCGVCLSKCPQGARLLRRDESRGFPMDVQSLIRGGTGKSKRTDNDK